MLMDDDSEKPARPAWMKTAGLLAGVTLVSGLGAGMLYAVFQDSAPVKKKSVQEISLLRPPPPPPPKVEEKPPEPEIKKEEVKLPEEQPDPEPQQADAPPPGPDLGVDSAASGSGDGFGLRAKPGGQDITTIGGGDGYRAYGLSVFNHVLNGLRRSEHLRGVKFEFKVGLRVDARGEMKLESMESTGDPDKDQRIRLAINEALRSTFKEPPAGAPTLFRMRFQSTS